MKSNNKRIVAGFELTLMIVSMFAFSYGIYASDEIFDTLDKQYKEQSKILFEARANVEAGPSKSFFEFFIDSIVEKFRAPMIPMASAYEINFTLDDGSTLTEEITVESFSISSEAAGAGCCFVGVNGDKCVTTDPLNCADGSPFAEGALCSSTSFCKKGCCYDEGLGIYDRNTLESDCDANWTADPNCNMPGARLGCCVLGTSTIFETRGQCEVDTEELALGVNSVTDWRPEIGEAQCVALSAIQTEGACVLNGGSCKFITESDCFSYEGEFNEGYLCTAKVLNTTCEKTEQTTCVEGKDGVYFLDSCGNPANVYDSSKLNFISFSC